MFTRSLLLLVSLAVYCACKKSGAPKRNSALDFGLACFRPCSLLAPAGPLQDQTHLHRAAKCPCLRDHAGTASLPLANDGTSGRLGSEQRLSSERGHNRLARRDSNPPSISRARREWGLESLGVARQHSDPIMSYQPAHRSLKKSSSAPNTSKFRQTSLGEASEQPRVVRQRVTRIRSPSDRARQRGQGEEQRLNDFIHKSGPVLRYLYRDRESELQHLLHLEDGGPYFRKISEKRAWSAMGAAFDEDGGYVKSNGNLHHMLVPLPENYRTRIELMMRSLRHEYPKGSREDFRKQHILGQGTLFSLESKHKVELNKVKIHMQRYIQQPLEVTDFRKLGKQMVELGLEPEPWAFSEAFCIQDLARTRLFYQTPGARMSQELRQHFLRQWKEDEMRTIQKHLALLREELVHELERDSDGAIQRKKERSKRQMIKWAIEDWATEIKRVEEEHRALST